MSIVKSFHLLEVNEKRIDNEKTIKLSYGSVNDWEHSYRSQTVFNTEQEAIEYAYKENKYADWVILPVISFHNFGAE